MKQYWFEEDFIEMPFGVDRAFQLKGRKFIITNSKGDELELEVGEEYWITDVVTGREGINQFCLHNTQTPDEQPDPYEWTPILAVSLDAPEEVKEYAEEHCWGNLNADEQRTMAECPVVERFGVACPRCRML